MQTSELKTAFQQYEALVPGFRIAADAEGWPMTPGKYGRIEFYTADTLAVFTDGPRTVGKLGGIPGVRRHQIGDTEARVLFPPALLPVVAQALRLQRKRTLSSEEARKRGAKTAYKATSRAQDEPGAGQLCPAA